MMRARGPASVVGLQALAVALMLAGSAGASTGAETASGFAAGFLHPLSGLDHLLAMVAIGIWGVYLGPPLLWLLPIAFPLIMVVDGVVGIAGISLPHVQIAVSLSVITLGAAIALSWRASIPVALGIVAFFAFFHGHAHGTELPRAVTPEAYAAG